MLILDKCSPNPLSAMKTNVGEVGKHFPLLRSRLFGICMKTEEQVERHCDREILLNGLQLTNTKKVTQTT